MKTDHGLIIIGCLGFLILMTLAGLIPFYFESPSMLYKFGTAKFLLRSGKVFGIWILILLIVQVMLAARLKWLDNIFGLDRLWRFHKINGTAVAVLAVIHAVFIFAAEGFDIFPFEKRYWPEFLGMAVLTILLGLVLVSFFRNQIKLSFQAWFTAHRMIAPVLLILVFVHVSNVSKSFESGAPRVFLLMLAGAAIIFQIVKWGKTVGVFSRPYQVVSITQAAKDTWRLTTKPKAGHGFKFMPGQFAFVTPIHTRLPRQSHPFTIASSPLDNGSLEFIIRSCGDFSHNIQWLETGDTLLIDGPYGRFCHQLLKKTAPLVMIAGGIGITPFLSMLRSIAKIGQKLEICLLWSNKSVEYIVFESEFDRFKQQIPTFSLHHIFTRQTVDPCNFKRINRESLSALLTDISRQADIFLCGPKGLVDGVQPILKDLGFSAAKVYTESFML